MCLLDPTLLVTDPTLLARPHSLLSKIITQLGAEDQIILHTLLGNDEIMCTRNRHTRIISELLTWHDNKFCQLIPPYATQIPGIPRYYRQPKTLHC